MNRVYENLTNGEITNCRKRAVRWNKEGHEVAVYVLKIEIREYVYFGIM